MAVKVAFYTAFQPISTRARIFHCFQAAKDRLPALAADSKQQFGAAAAASGITGGGKKCRLSLIDWQPRDDADALDAMPRGNDDQRAARFSDLRNQRVGKENSKPGLIMPFFFETTENIWFY